MSSRSPWWWWAGWSESESLARGFLSCGGDELVEVAGEALFYGAWPCLGRSCRQLPTTNRRWGRRQVQGPAKQVLIHLPPPSWHSNCESPRLPCSLRGVAPGRGEGPGLSHHDRTDCLCLCLPVCGKFSSLIQKVLCARNAVEGCLSRQHCHARITKASCATDRSLHVRT